MFFSGHHLPGLTAQFTDDFAGGLHPSEAGFGVSVTRFWKQGSVDYKKVPELKGVDLEAYRQKGRWERRVSVGK